MKAIRPNGFHTVDSSINDLTPERAPLSPPPKPGDPPPPLYDSLVPANYPPNASFPKAVNTCERQGRCTLGCLPGARHTLNKQLMGAAYGKPTDPVPVPAFPNIEIRALAEVDVISPSDDGYIVEYFGTEDRSRKSTPVRARRVVIAAGCLGTNEILLRCRERETLRGLSPRLGEGFSTNGDFIAFLNPTKEPVNLSRGPVQTSVAHFNDQPGENNRLFHIVEDEGIPKALASTVGFGEPLVQSLTRRRRLPLLWILFKSVVARGWRNFRALSKNAQERQEFFKSEEELTMNMMCITASGRDQAKGKLRLGNTNRRETSLRVSPMDKIPFHKDPIFTAINQTLNGDNGLANQLVRPEDKGKRQFKNPFLSPTAEALEADSVTISHPLGGCRIGKDATSGVVDEFGRVFDQSSLDGRGFYEGLYVADAAIIPTALGVNPSLTISALALRVAERIVVEWGEVESENLAETEALTGSRT
ncbi:MAG: hypothetical protein HYR85_18350 [Planctomycetes bacterium]|nr:hypothetical protein [Planctomycetota bacterium]MBI3847841.1 hypothetical protein [Planctomycetota bacterium]